MATKTDITAEVVKLRDSGMKFNEIAAKLGVTVGKVLFADMVSNVTDKTRIKFKNDEDLAAKVVKARDVEKNSWGQISARSGVSEGKIKRLYTEATGVSTAGLRLEGKGGRTAKTDEAAKTPAKKATAAKTPAKKATTAKTPARRPRVKTKADANPS